MRMLVGIITLASTSLIAYPVLAQGRVAYETLWESVLHLDQQAGLYVAVMDFNGDEYKDLLLGHNSHHTVEKTPLFLLINKGDGTFDQAAGDDIIGDLRAAFPIGTTADFNGDGRLDVAIFDSGNTELGQDPVETGFYGEAPQLLLSDENGTFVISSALEDAERADNPDKEGKLHIKFASTGDIDNDGDADIYVESGGGFNNSGHFLINNGDDTFFADGSAGRIGDVLRFRYLATLLHDMNNDGLLDLVMGQLRRINNDQEDLASTVAYNDGNGHFPLENARDLPYASWNDGWTYVHSIVPFDLNEDELPDLILAHQRAYDDDRPDEANTGLYLQFLINNGDSTFRDATATYIGDQSATTPSHVDQDGRLYNNAKLQLVDMNNDGHLDLVTAEQGSEVAQHAPFIYLNNGTNFFAPIDPHWVTNGVMSFGENAYPIHLNGDGLIDLVHTDLLPGPDGVYDTGDEITVVISMLAIQDGPTDVERSGQLPDRFGLSQNYPNPFNSGTTITFDLPKPSHVTLSVYNLMGQKVATLLSAAQPAGHHAMPWDATGFPSGVYVYRLQADDYLETRKLLLLK